ncbi:MAG TPA: NlpC/P60 family protein [Desulfobacterales bacterium]|nr:NlpC/P60 family protein [Desulfobacterales bacterium]
MRRNVLWLIAGLLLVGITQAKAVEPIGKARDKIVRGALGPLGIPYVWGGINPRSGLDCSGFTLNVYRWAGLDLPRVSAEQFRYTVYLRPHQVRPGDLVFFNMKLNPRKKVDHVGIYLGAGWFAQASFSKGVIIDNLWKPYYRERLRGIRRHPALVGRGAW